MPRYALTIEYDGGPFVGWQRQANGLSVQQRLEEAVAAINGARAIVHGAGRTDAGVHALGQVAHIDMARVWRADKLRDALNAHLKPAPVAVIAARAVDGEFEARFSAIRRHYRYIIDNRRAPLALTLGRARNVRPIRRCARWSGSMCDGSARGSRSRFRRAPFCIIRCAPWPVRSNMSAPANGRPRIWLMR